MRRGGRSGAVGTIARGDCGGSAGAKTSTVAPPVATVASLMMSYSQSQPPRLRFLVAGPLSPQPTGRRSRLLLAELAERMSAAPLAIKLDVGPALGAAKPVEVTAKFARFRDFGVSEVIGQAFGELHRLGERLLAPAGRPRTDDFLAALEKIVGRGKLHAEVTELLAPPAEKPADKPADAGGDLVEELLSRGTGKSSAAAAVDALVGQPRAKLPPGIDAGPAKAIHGRLAAALARAARSALEQRAVQAAEVRWRALRLFLGQCPRDQEIEVELLDAAPGAIAAALAELADREPMARPDAVFVIDPVATIAEAAALAQAAADLYAPVCVELLPAAFGCASVGEVAGKAAGGGLGDEWKALRGDPASRWLTAVVNPPALAAEATPAGERVVTGGAALAVAGLFAGSYRDAKTFARLGRDAGLRAPAAWHSRQGQEDMSIGTRELIGSADQEALAGQGLAPLASPRDSDLLVLAACPVVEAGEEPGNFAGQLLVGRTVRFALWAREAAPAGASAAQAAEAITQAAALVLLPGTDLRPRFGAALLPGEGGAVLKVGASYPAGLAGLPVLVQFALPYGKPLG